jgi:uncharacterized protein
MLQVLICSLLAFTSPSPVDPPQENCKGEIKDGKRTGSWKCFYDDGKLQTEGGYVNGLKDGPWKLYHANGKVAGEGVYEKDHEKGKWKFYDEDGQVMLEQEY